MKSEKAQTQKVFRKPKSKRIKILLIGQAPPLKKQKHPYDTTMLYDWLDEIGVTKKEAQNLFEFEAMTDKKPRINARGNHMIPTRLEMENYMNKLLYKKIAKSHVVILMGKCPIDFFGYDSFYIEDTLQTSILFTVIHPSKRNITRYRKNKENILGIFKRAIELNERNN